MRAAIPNLLSALRIAGAPILVAIALAGRRELYFLLLIGSQVTDFLDGFLARRLNVQTKLGAKLDIVGDGANYVVGAAGLYAFFPLDGPALWTALVFGVSVGARFAWARWRAGEWIHPVPLASAKVNFYAQSAFVLALTFELRLSWPLFWIAVTTGLVESAMYLAAVGSPRRNRMLAASL